MHFHFHAEQWFPYPRELVFAFFANPENLPRLMPKWQKARIEEAMFAPPPPRPEGAPRYPGIAAGSGTRLTITVKPAPVPLAPRIAWMAKIEDFRWNEGFCDVQVQGPFAYWKHCHAVSDANSPKTGLPGTLLTDDVDYELPVGGLSGLANAVAVRPMLSRTFAFRQKRTAELLARMTGQVR